MQVLFSHGSMRLGRSLPTRLSCRPRSSARTSPPSAEQDLRSRCRRLQRVQDRVLSCGCLQAGQPRQKAGSGRVQVAHSGLVRVPPRINSTWPQPAQRARRFWQALHHGRLVAREISQGALRPQIEQIILATRRPG